MFTHSITTDFLYMIRRYVNNEGGKWTVTVNFTKFNGMRLLEPEEGTTYTVEVENEQSYTVICRLDIAGYGWAEQTQYQIG